MYDNILAIGNEFIRTVTRYVDHWLGKPIMLQHRSTIFFRNFKSKYHPLTTLIPYGRTRQNDVLIEQIHTSELNRQWRRKMKKPWKKNKVLLSFLYFKYNTIRNCTFACLVLAGFIYIICNLKLQASSPSPFIGFQNLDKHHPIWRRKRRLTRQKWNWWWAVDWFVKMYVQTKSEEWRGHDRHSGR